VPDFKVLEFNYRVIQLNRLNWRDFLRYQNPAASALMAKMKIAPCDRQRLQPATDSNRWLIAKPAWGLNPRRVWATTSCYFDIAESNLFCFQRER